MIEERRKLGLTGIELPPYGLRASHPFDVIGKESQASRAHLVRQAIDSGIDFFGTSPVHGDAPRVLAAGLIGYRHRAMVMSTIENPEIAAAYRELDVSLHLFDGRVELLLAGWSVATNELLTSLARIRSMGDTIAIGVACRSVDELREAASRIRVEGLDLIAIPATLLSVNATHGLLDEISSLGCGLIAYVPDGLEAVRGESLDNMKVNLSFHRLASAADVLFKLALSDNRIDSVLCPMRRVRDLDHFATIAAGAPFQPNEMNALRTG